MAELPDSSLDFGISCMCNLLMLGRIDMKNDLEKRSLMSKIGNIEISVNMEV